MLKRHPWLRKILETLPVCLVLLGPGAAEAGSASQAALDAQSTPLVPRVVFEAEEEAPTILQGCDTLGVANQCFDLLGSTYLSVSAFFDSREPIRSDQYFLKLFQNTTTDTVRLTGMGFYTQSSSAAANLFQAAGAIIAGPELLFPEPQALLDLLRVGVAGQPLGTMTCVPFAAALDPKGGRVPAVVGPGEWAWAVLRFPELGSGSFVRIRVDTDPNDQPCDYLTPDGGRHWFRPDPRNGPAYDWGITIFTQQKASRPVVEPVPTWTLVKTLYR